MTTTLRNLSPRRKIAAIVLGLSLLGTGIASIAQLTDTVIHQNNFAVLTVDLVGSNDGSTFTQSLSQDWLLEGTNPRYKPVALKNSSNTAITLMPNWSATGSASITGAAYALYEGVSIANCNAGNVTGGTIVTGGSATVGFASINASPWPLAVGASITFSQKVTPSVAPAQTDLAVQAINWVATAQ